LMTIVMRTTGSCPPTSEPSSGRNSGIQAFPELCRALSMLIYLLKFFQGMFSIQTEWYNPNTFKTL
jgi:hypothetical protein